MPEWMMGLNCAWFTLPVLAGCLIALAAMLWRDWRGEEERGGS